MVAMAARASAGRAELLQPTIRRCPLLATVRETARAKPTLQAAESRQFSSETHSKAQCCRQRPELVGRRPGSHGASPHPHQGPLTSSSSPGVRWAAALGPTRPSRDPSPPPATGAAAPRRTFLWASNVSLHPRPLQPHGAQPHPRVHVKLQGSGSPLPRPCQCYPIPALTSKGAWQPLPPPPVTAPGTVLSAYSWCQTRPLPALPWGGLGTNPGCPLPPSAPRPHFCAWLSLGDGPSCTEPMLVSEPRHLHCSHAAQRSHCPVQRGGRTCPPGLCQGLWGCL